MATEVTIGHVEKIVLEFLRLSNVRIDRWNFEPLEGGFSSNVTRIRLKWSTTNGQLGLPDEVVVKVTTNGLVDNVFDKICGQKSQQRTVQMVCKTECDTYKILSMTNGTVAIPKIYGCESGIIVMEDMCTRAGICENLAAGFSLGQWRSVVLYLANLHAWSLKTDLEWRSKLPVLDRESDVSKFYVDLVKKRSKPTMQKYREYFGHVDESIYKKVITLENLVDNFKTYATLIPEVMSHNDVWTNNIFFAKDQNDPDQLSDEVAAFIDWQATSSGCGLNDVARVAIWSVHHKLRSIHEQELLQLYVKEFNHKSGLRIGMENAQRVYDHLKAVFGLIGVPATDLMLCSIKKSDKKHLNHDSRTEILNRMAKNYDFASVYFKSRIGYHYFEVSDYFCIV